MRGRNPGDGASSPEDQTSAEQPAAVSRHRLRLALPRPFQVPARTSARGQERRRGDVTPADTVPPAPSNWTRFARPAGVRAFKPGESGWRGGTGRSSTPSGRRTFFGHGPLVKHSRPQGAPGHDLRGSHRRRPSCVQLVRPRSTAATPSRTSSPITTFRPRRLVQVPRGQPAKGSSISPRHRPLVQPGSFPATAC